MRVLGMPAARAAALSSVVGSGGGGSCSVQPQPDAGGSNHPAAFTARYRRVDGAIHRDARVARAGCVPCRRHRVDARPGAAGRRTSKRRRGARKSGSLAAMARLCRPASVDRGGHHEGSCRCATHRRLTRCSSTGSRARLARCWSCTMRRRACVRSNSMTASPACWNCFGCTMASARCTTAPPPIMIHRALADYFAGDTRRDRSHRGRDRRHTVPTRRLGRAAHHPCRHNDELWRSGAAPGPAERGARRRHGQRRQSDQHRGAVSSRDRRRCKPHRLRRRARAQALAADA